MTALGAPSVVSSETDLRGLADTAQRALEADVVVILELTAGGEPAIVSTVGLGAEQRERLEPALVALAGALVAGEPLDLPSLQGCGTPGVAGLCDRGYASALGAARCIAKGRGAAVVAVGRQPGGLENPELTEVFALQAATALDRPFRRRSGSMTDRLESLAALDQLVLSATTLEQLSAALTELIAPLFGAASTGITVWDDQRQVLRLLVGSFGSDEAEDAFWPVSAQDVRSHSARVFTTGRSYFSNDVFSDPGFADGFGERFAVRRVLSVPLVLAGQVIGVLHLVDKEDEFTTDDLDRAEALSTKIAAVVELARAHVRLRTQRRLEEVLSDAAVALASGESAQSSLVPAFAELGRSAEASLLALISRDDEPILWRRGDVLAETERNVLAEAATMPGVRAYVVGPQFGDPTGWAVFHAPVHLGAQRLGTLVALRAWAAPFNVEERHAVVRLANLAALARATERYQQQRAELARLHERQRIAEDLHDDVAQLLFAAQLSLDSALERDGVDGEVVGGIAQARGLLVRGDTAIRTVINRLSGPPASDLARRLASAVARVEDACSQAIHLEMPADAVLAAKGLGGLLTDALVELAQHAAMSAAAQEGPCRITVRLARLETHSLVLTIEDDGVGRSRRDTRDLTAVRQVLRANGGTLRIRTEPTGTSLVIATVPVQG